MLVEAVQVVSGVVLDSIVCRVVVKAVQVVPVVVVDTIASRSAREGSTGSTRGFVEQYCQ